jgi:hypothetical protein
MEGFCRLLAEFMVIWRWENMLLNEVLKWSLKMLLLSDICAAADADRHLCENVEQQRKERGVKKQWGCT